MSALARKTCRDLRASRGPLLGIAALVALVVVLMAGGYRARAMLADSRDAWSARLRLADLDLRFPTVPPGVAAHARRIVGVADAEERMLLPGTLEVAGRKPIPAILHLLPSDAPPRLDAWHVLEGRYPARGESAVLVDRSVRQALGTRVGEQVIVRADGFEHRLPVVGVSLSPEYPIVPVHPEFELPLQGSLAVVGLSSASVAGMTGVDLVDSLLVEVAPGADPASIRARLARDLGVRVTTAELQADGPGRAITRMILEDLDLDMPPVVFVFVGVALLLLVLTLGRVVEREHAVIGTLLAMGHRSHRLVLGFVPLAVVPVLAGTTLGAAVHGAVARSIFDGYVEALGWPPLVDRGAGVGLLVASGACLFAALAVCLATAVPLVRRVPLRLLRPTTAPALGAVASVAVHSASRAAEALSLAPSVRLGLANALRRWRTTAASAVGLGAVFAVVTALIFIHLTNRGEIRESIRRMTLDATVRFRRPVGDTVAAEVGRLVDGTTEPIVVRSVVVTSVSSASCVRAICTPAGRWTARLRLGEGRVFGTADALEALLDHRTADQGSIRVGDRVTCRATASDTEGVDVTVVGLVDGITFGFIVLPLETGRRLFGLAGLSTGVHVASPVPAARLEEVLGSASDVEWVSSSTRAVEGIEQTVGGTVRILGWTLLLAIAAAVVFLSVAAAFEASDRTADVAVLRALGWRDRALFTVTLSEMSVRTLLALAVAVPASPWFARWLLDRMTAANHFHMELATPAWVYAIFVGGVLLFVPLGALPVWLMSRRLEPARVPQILARE